MGAPAPTPGTGLLAKGMDRNLLNSRGSRAGPSPAMEGALAVAGWGLKHLWALAGEKGEHEPAGARLFELGTELFGPGS